MDTYIVISGVIYGLTALGLVLIYKGSPTSPRASSNDGMRRLTCRFDRESTNSQQKVQQELRKPRETATNGAQRRLSQSGC